MLERRRLALLAIERLMEIAQFNQDYLHLDGGPQADPALFRSAGPRGRIMPMPLPPGIDPNFEFNSTRLLDKQVLTR
jgi:hypothetical protein